MASQPPEKRSRSCRTPPVRWAGCVCFPRSQWFWTAIIRFDSFHPRWPVHSDSIVTVFRLRHDVLIFAPCVLRGLIGCLSRRLFLVRLVLILVDQGQLCRSGGRCRSRCLFDVSKNLGDGILSFSFVIANYRVVPLSDD
jgi:hypothetical protein